MIKWMSISQVHESDEGGPVVAVAEVVRLLGAHKINGLPPNSHEFGYVTLMSTFTDPLRCLVAAVSDSSEGGACDA